MKIRCSYCGYEWECNSKLGWVTCPGCSRKIGKTEKNENTVKKTIKCPKCDYEWDSTSELNWITCPNCQRKFAKDKDSNEAC